VTPPCSSGTPADLASAAKNLGAGVTVNVTGRDPRGTVDGADMSTGARLARWLSIGSTCRRSTLAITVLPRRVSLGLDEGSVKAALAHHAGVPTNLARVTDAMGETRDFGITHVGELARADGAEFTAGEAAEVLYLVANRSSFAVGRWVPPELPVGYDAAGNVAWEAWASWRCDPAESRLSWWDNQTVAGSRNSLAGP
jgi:hypothetical protein